MQALLGFATNEIELVGTGQDWSILADTLNSGSGSISLNRNGEALPYDALAKSLVVEQGSSELAHVAIVDNAHLRISGSTETLRQLAINAQEMITADFNDHVHIDWLILPNVIREDSATMVWCRIT